MQPEDRQRLSELGVDFLISQSRGSPLESVWTIMIAVDLNENSDFFKKVQDPVFRVNVTFLGKNGDDKTSVDDDESDNALIQTIEIDRNCKIELPYMSLTPKKVICSLSRSIFSCHFLHFIFPASTLNRVKVTLHFGATPFFFS